MQRISCKGASALYTSQSYGYELVLRSLEVHSPLLLQFILVDFSSHTDMLKFGEKFQIISREGVYVCRCLRVQSPRIIRAAYAIVFHRQSDAGREVSNGSGNIRDTW